MPSRPYTSEGDLVLLIDFARTVTGARWPGTTYWHIGDLVWLLFAGTDFDARRNVRLSMDHEAVVGVAWFEPPDYAQFDVRPGTTLDIMNDMLAWAEQRCSELKGLEGDDVTLTATALESHADRIALLERNDYARTDRYGVRMRRSLRAPIAAPPLPEGMRLRHATDADIDERVDVHRDAWSVWGPSRVTAEAYRRLRKAPRYEQELDVVLETADGTFASYCIGWQDQANGVGYFEPVGTRPHFAGQGLARLVVFETLHRLRERGMHTAVMQTASINPRALALYQSCGFEVIEREYWYEKRLS